jgi:hypothetical protein
LEIARRIILKFKIIGMNWRYYYTLSDWYLFLKSEEVFFGKFGSLFRFNDGHKKFVLMDLLGSLEQNTGGIHDKITTYVSIFYLLLRTKSEMLTQDAIGAKYKYIDWGR